MTNVEIDIMPAGNAERGTTRALSLVAACSVTSGLVRPRVAPTFGTRSQGGVGSSGVSGMWRTDLEMTDPAYTDSFTHQKFYDHKFTTRQGPPICSPPA